MTDEKLILKWNGLKNRQYNHEKKNTFYGIHYAHRNLMMSLNSQALM